MEKLQAEIQKKVEEMDILQKEGEKREEHIDSLEKQVEQLRNIIEEKEQLSVQYKERETKLEEQLTEVLKTALVYCNGSPLIFNYLKDSVHYCRIRYC